MLQDIDISMPLGLWYLIGYRSIYYHSLREENPPFRWHSSQLPYESLPTQPKRTLAKAISKIAIKRIEDHQILEEAKSYIQHVNTRLQHYKLTLSIVEKKQTVLEELL